MRLGESDGALAAKMSLKIGHEESGSDSLAGDVRDDHAEAFAAEIEEIVIIPADVASLETEAGKFKRLEGWQSLRKKAGLHLLGNLELLRGAALGFQLFSDGTALRFDGMGDFIETDEREGVAIGIFETCKHAAPNGRGFRG